MLAENRRFDLLVEAFVVGVVNASVVGSISVVVEARATAARNRMPRTNGCCSCMVLYVFVVVAPFLNFKDVMPSKDKSAGVYC